MLNAVPHEYTYSDGIFCTGFTISRYVFHFLVVVIYHYGVRHLLERCVIPYVIGMYVTGIFKVVAVP